MGKKITEYPNNVSTNPDDLSLMDLSEKTGLSTFESRKWTLTAFKAWVNSWVVAGSVAWNNITGKPNVVDTTGGTPNYVAKFTDTDTIEESQIFDDGTNVGIGTATPSAKLDVIATSIPGGEVLAQFKISDDASSGLKISNNTGTDGRFTPNIYSTGSHPQTALVITGNTLDDNGAVPITVFDARKNGSAEVITRPLFSWRNYGTDIMQINANGRVGIGTTSPGAKLHIVGNAMVDHAGVTPLRVSNTLVTSGDTSGVTGIYLGDAASGVNMIQREKHTANSAGINLYSEYGYNTQSLVAKFQYNLAKIFVGAIQRFHITGNGDVGIGDNITPSAKLHVNNTTTAYSFLVEDDANPDSTPFVIGNKGNVSIGDFPADETVKLTIKKTESGAVFNRGEYIQVTGGSTVVGLEIESKSSTGDNVGGYFHSQSSQASANIYGIQSYAQSNLFVGTPISIACYGVHTSASGAILNVGVYSSALYAGASNYCFQGRDGTEDAGKFLKSVTTDGKANWAYIPKTVQLAVSDETTALTTGTGKITFRMPHAMTLTEVRASLTTAQASGNIFTVDINEGGFSILSTKLTIDNNEKTSVTATTQPVISDTYLTDDTEITVDIDQIGNGTAKGLKITLIGY